MNKNVGGMDRTARLVLGPILLVVGIALAAEIGGLLGGTTALVFGAVAIVIGLVLLATALTRQCIINQLLGVNTYEGG